MPVVLFYVEKQREIPLEIDSYVLGRGLLECDNDKRISRAHGLIKVSENYEVTIKSTHTNPIFLRIQNDRKILKKDQELTLANGDRFSLLPDDKYSYELKFQDVSGEPEVRTVLRVRNTQEVNDAIENGELSNSNSSTVENLSTTSSALDTTVNSQSNSRKRNGSTEENESSKKARLEDVPEENSNAPTSTTTENQSTDNAINPTSSESAIDPNTSSSNINRTEENESRKESDPETVSANPEIESTTRNIEQHSATTTSETVSSSNPVPSANDNPVPVTSSSSSTSTVQVKTEPSDETPSSSNPNPDAGAATVKKEVKTEQEQDSSTANDNTSNPAPAIPNNQPVNPNNQPANPNPNNVRESCQFGIRCYRRTQDHRSEFAHPGDNDYRRPDFPPAAANAPPCPFGAACYRRNPEHFREYQHPPPDAVPVLPNVHVIHVNIPRQRPNRPNHDMDEDMSESDFDSSGSDDIFMPNNGFPFDSSSSGIEDQDEDDYDNFEGEE